MAHVKACYLHYSSLFVARFTPPDASRATAGTRQIVTLNGWYDGKQLQVKLAQEEGAYLETSEVWFGPILARIELISWYVLGIRDNVEIMCPSDLFANR